MKIIGGAALIAGAITLDIASAGTLTGLSVALGDTAAAILTSSTVALAVGGIGASMMMSGIADALHLNNTGQTAVGSHAPFKPWQIVYGRQRVSGTIIDLSLSDGGHGDNRWLWQVEVLAAHAVESIGGTYLNQQQAFCRSGTNGLTGNLIGSSNTDNGNMDIPGMALDIHPTDLNFREYTNFYFDGNPRFWMAQYDGTQTVADPFYAANCSHLLGTLPHWDSTCIVQGMAYSLNRFWSNANWAAGMPNVRYDVTGKNNIYDPRTSTYGYSENAALVLADYMCNQQYGMMYSIADFDSDTLIAAANICDEVVTLTNSQIIFNTNYTTEARYAINGTLSTSEGGGSVTTQMLAAMAGRISYAGGKWFIFPGVFQGVSGPALTETDLIGSIDWKPTRKSRDLFNEVRATFTCPSGWDTTYAPGFDVYNTTAQTVEDNFNGQWNQIDLPPMCFNALRDYSSDPYLTQDSGVKYIRNTQYPYTISVATAQRLAKIELLRNRWQGTGTLKLPITYLGTMPNDILTITYPRFGWTNKQLEVQSTHIDVGSVSDDGTMTPPTLSLGVSEVDASQYAWLATDELKLQGGQALSGASALIVQPPTAVTCTTGETVAQSTAVAGVFVPGLIVTWTAPADAYVVSGGKVYIQCAPVGSTNFATVGIVDGNTTSFSIPSLNNNTTYQVQLYASSAQGIYSDTTTPVSVTVTTGIPAVPPTLTGLTALPVEVKTASGMYVSQVSLAWTASTDLAVTSNGFIQVWCQPSGGTNTLIATVAGISSEYYFNGPNAGEEYAFSLVAVDVWGNQSSATSQVSITVPNNVAWDPSAPPLSYTLMPTSVLQGSTGTNINLIPDSSLNFGWNFWSNPGPDWSIASGVGLNGANAFVVTSAASGSFQRTDSASFNLIAGQTYTLSGYIDATHATAGFPVWTLYDPTITTQYGGATQNPGHAGRVNITFTIPGTAGTSVPVVLLFDVDGATLTGNILASSPMLQVGSAMTAYVSDTAAGAETASQALANAATAQAAATAAQGVLNTITGTSVLTPGEKASIVADYDALIAAQAANDAQADIVAVSRTAYDSALSALTAYLATLTAPVLWSNTTNYTTIVGTTFTAKFQAAYSAQDALLNAIAAAINSISTSANSAVLLQNPNFASGDVGWVKQQDWSIVPGIPLVSGSGYVAEWTSAATFTSAIGNKNLIPCAPGAVISAMCWIAGQSGSTANRVVIRINAFNASGTNIENAEGNPITTADGGWRQTRSVATMPAGTAYVQIDLAVFSGTGTWYASGFTASILPNSLAEVPDDPTGVYRKPVGISTGGQATTASIASGAVSAQLSYSNTAQASISGTPIQIGSVTQVTNGGFCSVRAVLQFIAAGTTGALYISLYKGDNTGTLLARHTNLNSGVGYGVDVIEAIDTSPAPSQLYTVYGQLVSGSSAAAGPIYMTTLNLKV